MRTIFFCAITCLIGLSIGLMVNVQVVGETVFTPPPAENTPSTSQSVSSVHSKNTAKASTTETNAETSDAHLGLTQEALLKQSYLVLNALQAKNYTALAKLVHPSKGVTFTPFSTVNKKTDRNFKPNELVKAKDSPNTYVWGLQDGSGLPIELTMADYMARFVFNADYTAAPHIGVNTVLSIGNSLENVAEAYPDCDFVEFYYPSVDPKNKGFDWCGLKLVFEPVDQDYLLVGIIHSEWTI